MNIETIDDEYETRNGNQWAHIKLEPVTDDVDAVLNQTDELKIREGANVNNLKQHHSKKCVRMSDGPTTNHFEKATYCCYLCGKTFQFLCRLLTHMTAHTNERKYQCTRCSKRYKSASSLSLHNRKCHFDESRKSRPKSTSKKTDKKTIRKRAVEISKNKYATSKQIEMKPMDMDDVEMEWAPLGVGDYVPFVWDESDLGLTLPTALINPKPLEMNENDQKVEEVQSAVAVNGLNCIAESRPTTKVNSSKFAIWEKETVDPSAMYVDILRAPASKRTRRSAASNALRLEETKNADNSGNSRGSMKNTELAIKFSGFGDIEFSLKNWDSARQWYNQSLCHAEQNTYYFSTAYAKRAKCYFNEGIYRECWTDLMFAQNSGLPEILLPELERHKQSCIAMINGSSSPAPPSNVEPMLSFAPDPSFPEMASVLQIDFNEYFGRHIRARQSLTVGQILIIENGFVANSTAYYKKCCICLTDDPNLMPCLRCTQAMLCRNCENFHQIECELQTALNLHSNPWATKVLRSFLNAICLFDTIDEMIEFVSDAVSSWRRMQSAAPIVDQKSKYRAFLQLITVPTIQPALNSIVSKLHAAIKDHPIIGLNFQTIKSQRFLAHLLIQHICVIDAFTTKVGGVDNENGCHEIIAPITSYLKHSCAPNVSKFLLGQSIIVVAMRPIAPGEQLFVSYCDILKNQNDRQNILQMEYGFQCSCERCAPSANMLWDGQQFVDQQFHTCNCDATEDFVRRNFIHFTSNNQVKRKQLTDHIMNILKRYGCMPWNYTITWAYVGFSLLLSQRFQKKLQY